MIIYHLSDPRAEINLRKEKIFLEKQEREKDREKERERQRERER